MTMLHLWCQQEAQCPEHHTSNHKASQKVGVAATLSPAAVGSSSRQQATGDSSTKVSLRSCMQRVSCDVRCNAGLRCSLSYNCCLTFPAHARRAASCCNH
jgi:hypothetical protein